jgi:antitoxin HicB
MTVAAGRSLEELLALAYPFEALADPDGGYVVRFPDLPGCITQVETLDELASAADEARTLWIETEYELGRDIPLPSQPDEYSGKFNVRLTRTLHRSLAEAAKKNGVSLNHYVSDLLARGDAQARIEQQIQGLSEEMEKLSHQIRWPVTGVPGSR